MLKVFHHLKILQNLKLVKVAREEVVRNFIKKYYVSTLSTLHPLLAQESQIFKDFKPIREEYLKSNIKNADSPKP